MPLRFVCCPRSAGCEFCSRVYGGKSAHKFSIGRLTSLESSVSARSAVKMTLLFSYGSGAAARELLSRDMSGVLALVVRVFSQLETAGEPSLLFFLVRRRKGSRAGLEPFFCPRGFFFYFSPAVGLKGTRSVFPHTWCGLCSSLLFGHLFFPSTPGSPPGLSGCAIPSLSLRNGRAGLPQNDSFRILVLPLVAFKPCICICMCMRKLSP